MSSIHNTLHRGEALEVAQLLDLCSTEIFRD